MIRTMEATRDGLRLVMAEAAHVERMLDVEDRTIDAEFISTVAHRLGTLMQYVVAAQTTLTKGLAATVKAERDGAYAEGKRDGREAWSDGFESGLETLRPMDRTTPETAGE